METEDLNIFGGHVPIPDEDSGSVYEEESEEEEEAEAHNSSQDEKPKSARSSRANSIVERGRSRGKKRRTTSTSPDQDVSKSERSKSRDSSTASERENRRRDAKEWAANFQAPEYADDILDPVRHSAGGRSKRTAVKSPSHVRAKRLKPWYSSEYREFLNLEIRDAVSRTTVEDQSPLGRSQIGCSIWTSREKNVFFSALSRLGRDDVKGIAERIASKSELEVQEYVQLLQKGMLEKADKLLNLTDLPAAIEISIECSELLERAGTALSSRQESTEEETEQGKWGDLWLIDQPVSKQLEREQKDNAARQDLEEKFPASIFFHTRTWLELSRRIFMNSASEEDNWENIAEPGEIPAIRATALEDFHSLAVSVTKRLVSTTLFCTMSRQRATGAKTIKHSEINADDVEAAVRILGFKPNTERFWRTCARRNNLKVFDEEWNSFMSPSEVEAALRETQERSRSRSISRQRSLSRATQSETEAEDQEDFEAAFDNYGSDDSLHGYESDLTDSASDSASSLATGLKSEDFSSLTREERQRERARAKKESELAHERYVNAFDQEASRVEELRLWALLRQAPPFEIKSDANDLPEQPKGLFRDDMTEGTGWRNYVHYKAPWEAIDTPVPEENFERNRKRISRRAMKRVEGERLGEEDESTGHSDADEDVGSAGGSGVDENDISQNAEEHMSGEEVYFQDRDQSIPHGTASNSDDEIELSQVREAEDDSEDHYEEHTERAAFEENAGSSEEEEHSPMSIDAALGFLRGSEEPEDADDGAVVKHEYENDS